MTKELCNRFCHLINTAYLYPACWQRTVGYIMSTTEGLCLLIRFNAFIWRKLNKLLVLMKTNCHGDSQGKKYCLLLPTYLLRKDRIKSAVSHGSATLVNPHLLNIIVDPYLYYNLLHSTILVTFKLEILGNPIPTLKKLNIIIALKPSSFYNFCRPRCFLTD